MTNYISIIISTKVLGLSLQEKENHSWVFWIHHHTFSNLKYDLISDFVNGLDSNSKNLKNQRVQNFIEAIQLLYKQYSFEAPSNILQDNLLIPTVLTDIQKMTINTIGKSSRQQFWYIPDKLIAIMKDVDTKNIRQTIKNNINNNIVLKQHASRKSKFCLACRVSSGDNMKQHPIFCGFLCESCYSEKALGSLLGIAKDGCSSTCSICLERLQDYKCDFELVLCNFCVRSYCRDCLSLYCGDFELDIIIKFNKWKCIACNPDLTVCALRRRTEKEQLKNIYGLFPAAHESYEKIIKTKAKVIHVFVSNFSTVNTILPSFGFPFKIFHPDSKSRDKLVSSQDAVKLLLEYYPENQSYEIEKFFTNYGTIEAFFSFYKSKVYFEDFAPFFWAFVSSASIIVEEQMTITRFCGVKPVLIGTNFPDIRQRGRFIWTNIVLVNKCVEQSRKRNIFLADISNKENDDEGETSFSYDSIYVILKTFIENHLEQDIE